MLRWYALTTAPHKELSLVENLTFRGYEAYAPVIKRRRIMRGKPIFSTRPVYSSYIFVRLDLSLGWVSLRYVPGAKKFVALAGSEGRPAPLPEGFVENHQAAGPLYEGMLKPLKPGDLVRIINSPVDIPLEVSRIDEHGRVCVLMAMFNSMREIAVARHMVEEIRVERT